MIFRIRDYKLRYLNLRLLLYVAILCFMGVQFVGSATANTTDPSGTMTKQIMGIAIGVVVMIVVALMDYHFILRLALPLYIFTVGILLFVRFKGATYNNATRWIEIKSISIQPSELCKMTLIIVFAALFTYLYKQEIVSKLSSILLAVAVFAVPGFLILKQPDLSTTLVIAATFGIMFIVVGLNPKIIGGIVGAIAAVAGGVILYAAKFADPDNVSNYQIKRIMAWLDPETFPDIVYQQTNSIMAIGNGGATGKGLFNSSLAAVKNGNYLSEQDTDFIFAVIGEEVGFIGSCAIIILLALIVIECLHMARKAKDMGGRLICVGYAGVIFFQSLFNISVATGLIPNTGLPLPFLSAGLSSMISLFIGLGFVLNVSMQIQPGASSGRF